MRSRWTRQRGPEFRWMLRVGVAVCVAVALGYLPYRIYERGSSGRALHLGETLQRIEAQNESLARENDQLKKELELLQRDPRALERIARDELGLVRASDIVFQFE